MTKVCQRTLEKGEVGNSLLQSSEIGLAEAVLCPRLGDSPVEPRIYCNRLKGKANWWTMNCKRVHELKEISHFGSSVREQGLIDRRAAG